MGVDTTAMRSNSRRERAGDLLIRAEEQCAGQWRGNYYEEISGVRD